MTQSAIQGNRQTSSYAGSSSRPDAAERRLRQVGAWSMLYLLLQAELGLAWDRRWHDLVGRDRFWIPPHILLYTGVGIAGVVALAIVLIDTFRYRRGAVGADDTSTISVFGFFHAPLGFVILGFGTLTDLLAAPLDNYWHELYGIDVTLWSPFHIMGTIGGLLIGFGIIYVFASEAAYAREGTRRFLGFNAPEWGALIFLAAFMELALPALTAFTPIAVGSLSLLSYPLLLALASASLIAAIQITRKPGAATLTALALGLLSIGTQAFIPPALRIAVAQLGFTFRVISGSPGPVFNYAIALMPLFFLLCAMIIDGVAYWQWRGGNKSGASLPHVWLLGLLTAFFAVFVPSLIVQLLAHFVPGLPMPTDVVRVLQLAPSNVILTLPLAFLIGAASALLGSGLGDIWYWSKL